MRRNIPLSLSNDRARIERLLEGFHAASVRASDPKAERPENLGGRFEQLLNGFDMAVEKWRQSQKQTADDFNLLDVMQVTGRETMHSGVLAWLLAPDIAGLGTHAQGSLGLKLFLEELGLPESYALGAYCVRTEVRGDESIVDVEVVSMDRFLIHIENKIWSNEGKDQTGREWRDIERRAGYLKIPKDSVHAFFLTRDGSTAAEKNFKSMSWARIARVFERFAEQAEPTEVKGFCNHYVRALRKAIVQQEETEEVEYEETGV